MRYEEWLDILKQIENSNKEDLLKQMLDSDYNSNINEMLEPKIIETIKYKFQRAIDKIIKNLEEIFYDVNNLDLYLVNYKKDINYINKLIELKQISPEKKQELKDLVRKETKNVYEILIKEANTEDPTGMYGLTIKNNQIKWSD